jgi:hypothetical protein
VNPNRRRSRIEDKRLRVFFHLGTADRGRYEDSTALRSKSGMQFLTSLELAPWTKSVRSNLVPNGITYLSCMLPWTLGPTSLDGPVVRKSSHRSSQ